MALIWEPLEDVERDFHGKSHKFHVSSRARITGGWLIKTLAGSGVGLAFIPDPTHEWDGHSPEPERAEVAESDAL